MTTSEQSSALQSQVSTLQAEVEFLRGMLRTHGAHRQECIWWKRTLTRQECNCGLWAAQRGSFGTTAAEEDTKEQAPIRQIGQLKD